VSLAALRNILTTNGAGVLSWSAAPGGGLTSVNTDGTTITSDSAPAALSCIAAPKLLTARNIDVAGSSGTTLGSIVPLSFDKTAATISALKLQYSTQERTRRGARKSKSNVERPAPAVDKPVDDGEQLTRISLAVD
jgi:hypothetical protein